MQTGRRGQYPRRPDCWCCDEIMRDQSILDGLIIIILTLIVISLALIVVSTAVFTLIIVSLVIFALIVVLSEDIDSSVDPMRLFIGTGGEEQGVDRLEMSAVSEAQAPQSKNLDGISIRLRKLPDEL